MLTKLKKIKIAKQFYQPWVERHVQLGINYEDTIHGSLTKNTSYCDKLFVVGNDAFSNICIDDEQDLVYVDTHVIKRVEEYIYDKYIVKLTMYYFLNDRFRIYTLQTYKVEIYDTQKIYGFNQVFNHSENLNNLGFDVHNIFQLLYKDLYNVAAPVIHSIASVISTYNVLSMVRPSPLNPDEFFSIPALENLVDFGYSSDTIDYIGKQLTSEFPVETVQQWSRLIRGNYSLYENINWIDSRYTFINCIEYIELLDMINTLHTQVMAVEINVTLEFFYSHSFDTMNVVHYENCYNVNQKLREYCYTSDYQLVRRIVFNFLEYGSIKNILIKYHHDEVFTSVFRVSFILSDSNEVGIYVQTLDSETIIFAYFNLTLMNLLSLSFISKEALNKLDVNV